jgi:hypothetical protein
MNKWIKERNKQNHTTAWPQILRISFINVSAALRTSDDLSYSAEVYKHIRFHVNSVWIYERRIPMK